MVVDVHTHIFPRKVREHRQRFFSGEPAFELLYRRPRSMLSGIGEILDTMDVQGVDKSVVFGFPWQDADTARMHNDYIADAVAAHPERFTGFGCFDPSIPEAASEAERCLASGLSGIGELAFYQREMDESALDHLEPVMEMLRERDLPALIHVNEPIGHAYPGKAPVTLSQIDALVDRFPENVIILAHWGGGIFFFHLLKKGIKDHLRNVYFDTAASPFLYDPAIYPVAAAIIGSRKVLFGSDYPLVQPERYFSEIKDAGLSAADTRGICGLNAVRLLKL